MYKNKPIRSTKSLSKALGECERTCEYISKKSERYYRSFMEKGRQIECPRKGTKLYFIQRKIKTRILDNVVFPNFVCGGVKGGSPKMCAGKHVGAKVAIHLDVKELYPSISAEQVYDMWRYSLHFSKDVAGILKGLTTYKGHLPTGCATSTHIANLILLSGDTEEKLCKSLTDEGYVYTRYMDDITVSSKRNLSNKEKTAVVQKILKFIRRKGLSANNGKTKIEGISRDKDMLGIRVGSRTLKIPKKTYDEVINRTKEGDISNESLEGKLSYIKMINPGQEKYIRQRIKQPF